MPDPINNNTSNNSNSAPASAPQDDETTPLTPPGELKKSHPLFKSTRFSMAYEAVDVGGDFKNVLRFDIRRIRPLTSRLLFKPTIGQVYPPIGWLQPDIKNLTQPVIIAPVLSGGLSLSPDGSDFQYLNLGLSLHMISQETIGTNIDARVQVNRVDGKLSISGRVNLGAEIRLMGARKVWFLDLPPIMGWAEYTPSILEWGLGGDDTYLDYNSGVVDFLDAAKNAFDAGGVTVGLKVELF